MNTSRDAPAKVVEAVVTRDEAEARFKQLAQVADAVEAASHLSTLDLEPNPKACSAYGGCPHAQRCNLTNQQKLKGLFTMAETLTDRMNKLKANKKAAVVDVVATRAVVQPINPPAAAIAEALTTQHFNPNGGINPPAIVAKDAAPTSAEIPIPINPPHVSKGGVVVPGRGNDARGVGDVKDIEALTDAVIKELAKRLGNLMAKV